MKHVLWDVNSPNPSHPFLPLFLLVKQLSFPTYISTITLCQHVLPQSLQAPFVLSQNSYSLLKHTFRHANHLLSCILPSAMCTVPAQCHLQTAIQHVSSTCYSTFAVLGNLDLEALHNHSKHNSLLLNS